jgi:uncharacterized protein (TIGR02001 family)
MTFLKNTIWAAIMAGTAITGATSAAQAETTFSGNVALTTDYKFRGISQTEGAIAVQGGFDASSGMFYAGAWASSLDLEEATLGTQGLDAPLELDIYAGFRPTLGPVTLDLGAIGYFYPGAAEDQIGIGELDYFEGYAKASLTVVEKLALGAAAYYSPEFTAETGNAFYLEANASYPLSDAFAVSGAIGYQSVDDVSGVFTSVTGPAEAGDEYTTWNVGATYSIYGFGLDLRYVDTDIDSSSLFTRDFFTTEGRGEGNVIFTVKRAL